MTYARHECSGVLTWYCYNNSRRTEVGENGIRLKPEEKVYLCFYCKARYRTAWGTLVEIFRDGVACYCLAGLPSPHMKDLKGLLVEQSFKHVKSAEGLYDSIPSIEPLAMDAFEPIPGRPGMWKLKAMQELEARPRFE